MNFEKSKSFLLYAIIRIIHIILSIRQLQTVHACYFCPQFFQMKIRAHQIKMMSKIRQLACEPPQPLRLLHLPFRVEYVLLRSFGLSPFQTLFVTLLEVIHNNKLLPLTVIICRTVCQRQKRQYKEMLKTIVRI